MGEYWCPFAGLKHKTSYGWTSPVDYEHRIYEVRLNGDVTLLEQSRTYCGTPIRKKSRKIDRWAGSNYGRSLPAAL